MARTNTPSGLHECPLLCPGAAREEEEESQEALTICCQLKCCYLLRIVSSCFVFVVDGNVGGGWGGDDGI